MSNPDNDQQDPSQQGENAHRGFRDSFSQTVREGREIFRGIRRQGSHFNLFNRSPSRIRGPSHNPMGSNPSFHLEETGSGEIHPPPRLLRPSSSVENLFERLGRGRERHLPQPVLPQGTNPTEVQSAWGEEVRHSLNIDGDDKDTAMAGTDVSDLYNSGEDNDTAMAGTEVSESMGLPAGIEAPSNDEDTSMDLVDTGSQPARNDPMPHQTSEKTEVRSVDEEMPRKRGLKKQKQKHKEDPLIAPPPAPTPAALTQIDLRRRIRNEWRMVTSLEGFGELAGWSPDQFTSIRSIFGPDQTIAQFIHNVGWMLIMTVRSFYDERPDLFPAINWDLVKGLTDDSQFDDLVVLFAQLVKICYPLKPSEIDNYHTLLLALYPKAIVGQSPDWRQRIEQGLQNALERQIVIPENRDYVDKLWKKIVEYFGYYEKARDLSPYTSIIAPMGCGKTRALQELARRYCYVSYLNLAAAGRLTIPKRSIIADKVATINDRGELTTFFDCYIASVLEQVLLCRQIGISSLGFWKIQALEEFRHFQQRIAGQIYQLFEDAKSSLNNWMPVSQTDLPGGKQSHYRIRTEDDDKPLVEGQTQFNRREYVDHLLGQHRVSMEKIFHDIAGELKDKSDASLLVTADPTAKLERKGLECLICLDETRELFKMRPNETVDMSKYGAVRRSFRHRAAGDKEGDSRLQFFGIVTDTSSRVSQLSPPKSGDQSLSSSATGYELFLPYWKIDTFDMAADENIYNPDELPIEKDLREDQLRRLFGLGRPLWPSVLVDRPINYDDILMFVKEKISDFRQKANLKPNERTHANELEKIRDLALLSYRSSFVVVSHSLSEHLASNYMHFIADISPDRSLVRTVQPSEPILSWTAAREMSLPKKRLDVVRSLNYHTQRGFIDPGDIGEMVSTIILLFAFDKAHDRKLPSPITLKRFFGALLSKQLCAQIQSRCDKNPEANKVWNGFVFFSQFVRTQGSDRKITHEVLRRAYARNTALIAPSSFEGCDLIVPIVVTEGTKKQMSYLLIQVKNVVSNKNLTPSNMTKAKNDLTPAVMKPATNDPTPSSSKNPKNQPTTSTTKKGKKDPKPNLDAPECKSWFGLFMSLKGETHQNSGETGADIVTAPEDKQVIVMVAGLDEKVYPALKEPEQMASTMRTLLESTASINLPEPSGYLQRLFPIDNVSGANPANKGS